MGPASGDNMHTEDKVNVPKLTHDGANWVDYRNRLLWLLESQHIDTHITADSMPSEYTNLGKVGGLEPQERWSKEEYAIRQVIGSSVPTTAFTSIKSKKTVKGAWSTLKKIYKEKCMGWLRTSCEDSGTQDAERAKVFAPISNIWLTSKNSLQPWARIPVTMTTQTSSSPPFQAHIASPARPSATQCVLLGSPSLWTSW